MKKYHLAHSVDFEPVIEPASAQYVRLHSANSPKPYTAVVADARRKISRDIHDSVIQPYIGLKLALEALARKVPAANPLSKDVERLVEMTSTEIAGLRRYSKDLRGHRKPAREKLGSVMRLQAARFGELHNIKISVDVAETTRVDDGLADEICHMLGEALSNIRRHTNASVVRIKVICDKKNLVLKIINPRDLGVVRNKFTPRSISERAHALGGSCSVETGSGRYTVVTVEIPIPLQSWAVPHATR